MHIESNFDIYVGVCAATGRYARCLQLKSIIITKCGIDRDNISEKLPAGRECTMTRTPLTSLEGAMCRVPPTL